MSLSDIHIPPGGSSASWLEVDWNGWLGVLVMSLRTMTVVDWV